MHIVCVICSDLLTPSDDVFHTPCGHIFHFTCLTQWLERSKTCPQCRERTTSNKIHRIYFNISNNDSIVEDSTSLQCKIDKLKFDLILKDTELKQYHEKSEKLQTQVTGLKAEVSKVERELSEKTSAIYALKDQIKFFKDQVSETGSLKQEVTRLRKKIEELRTIQKIIDDSAEDVEEMVTRTKDPSSLIVYISVLKREMTNSLDKRRELRNRVKSLQQELTKVSMERNFLCEEREKRKQLEELLMISESEKIALQNRLREIEGESSIVEVYHRKNNTTKTNDHNNIDISVPNKNTSVPIKSNSFLSKPVNINTINKKKSQADMQENAAKVQTVDDAENSPYLPVKSLGVLGGMLRESNGDRNKQSSQLGNSILSKKSRISHMITSKTERPSDGKSYDGFGGHSREDVFPVPVIGTKQKRKGDSINKTKKLKLDTGDNKKISNFIDLS